MRISLKDEKLILSFPYDARLVAIAKSLPGRTFDRSTRQWMVPVVHGDRLLAAFKDVAKTVDSHAMMEIVSARERLSERIAHQTLKPGAFESSLPLHEFQKVGAQFLWFNRTGLLADAPGLGKTIQTIAALRNTPGRILVFCPASLKFSWEKELKQWGESDIMVVDGDKFDRKVVWGSSYRWTIANYELLLHDWDFIAKEYDAIVCDEATRISNPQAKSVKALKLIKAHKKIALSGTPISNSPLDLWSIVDWLEPGYLGTYPQFLERYMETDYWGKVVGYKRIDELRELVKPYVLRRIKEEVLTDLPPKTVETIEVKLSAEEKRVYDGVRKELVAEVLDYLGKINSDTLSLMPVRMLRLKQATDHLQLLGEKGESSKLETLEDVLRPVMASGEKAIVFTQFAKMADILMERVGGVYLSDPEKWCIQGKTPVAERQAIVDAFNAHKGPGLLVMTEAGAYGLNLQGASYVVHYDLPWSVAKLQQREDRAHRMGQTKPVTVYNLIATDTIDEYVNKVIHKKSTVSSDVLGDADRLENAGIDEEHVRAILRI